MNQDHDINEPICELDNDTKSLLKDAICSVKASPELKKRIANKIELESGVSETPEKGKVVLFYKKPVLMAACIAVLIGLGMLLPTPFTKLPTLAQLHNEHIQIQSNNLSEISDYLGIKLNETDLLGFTKEGYKLVGASKKNVKGQQFSFIVLNKEDKRVSVCFLPESYQLSGCHKVEVIGVPSKVKWNVHKSDDETEIVELPTKELWTVYQTTGGGTEFDCGTMENCRFAYWQKNHRLIAVVANDLSDLEMIDVVMPLRNT